ncbi:type II CAAX prenyl endopeptidase Rce1 family protein [Sulfobacillus harzensis]|uniref:CPBP family intramembrane metalloprotease n=1 Tax=Sulfobacillus harzensis TaxID=2729629 RepID=A0A7Y0L3M7_9FIRM|nr:CPBP family glutamic-type intramembrane protease [Sulfobacillus harzensis]NMP22327.1 CPBP family intramembrane metalloprotease [Sulfobacillus harzensis]
MKWNRWIRWPGISSPDPLFLRYIGRVPTWRMVLATAAGGLMVLVMGQAAHSSAVGYGYGGIFFVALSWPLLRAIVRSLNWTDGTIWQTVLLVIASLAMGAVGDKILGFNPQAAKMHQISWPEGQHLLWQFPLVLPVENLVLLGGLVAVWQIVRPRTAFERMMVAILAAFVFGLWHVPAWGGWTMLVIGLTVLPWTLYLLATGDMLVPILAHIVMDTLAVTGTAAPTHSLLRHLADPVLLLALLVLGLAWSILRERRERRHS